ncbi:MAG: DUF72 domain-containing protein [Citrobacter freundii]|nr:MAG: DUF72 domain-containing protein [Citrobacter freundii]
MKKGKIHIGTSGWHYKHWKDVFYPEGVTDKDQLNFYSTVFKTVEINNSFYRLPSEDTFIAWRTGSPGDFLFAVKGSRFITHLKKLNLDKEGIKLFFSRVKYLKQKLGPILFQLPPRWKFNGERFKSFLSILPKKYRYAFEFRDPTWYNQQTYDLLKEYNCAFCIYELAGHHSPTEITADFIYLRAHGPTDKKYQGSYSNTDLKRLAKQCLTWRSKGKDVFIYFDNDQAGYAAENARKLQQLVAGK